MRWRGAKSRDLDLAGQYRRLIVVQQGKQGNLSQDCRRRTPSITS